MWFVWRFRGSTSIVAKVATLIPIMQMAYPVLISVSQLFPMLVDTISGTCSIAQAIPNSFNCGNIISAPIPFTIIMLVPLLSNFVIQDNSRIAIAAPWIVSIGTTLIHSFALGSVSCAVAGAIYAFSSALIYHSARRQNTAYTRVIERLQDTLEENRRLAVEVQATELQAVIGNVAHDMKTVRIGCDLCTFT